MLTRKRPREISDDDIEWSGQSACPSSCESATESSTDRSDYESDEPSSGPCTSTRSQKRAKAKELYLKGKSRKPYRKSKNLSSSFEDTDLPSSPSQSNPVMTVHFEPSEWNVKMCKSCAPVLMKYSETFKGMKRQGTELKR